MWLCLTWFFLRYFSGGVYYYVWYGLMPKNRVIFIALHCIILLHAASPASRPRLNSEIQPQQDTITRSPNSGFSLLPVYWSSRRRELTARALTSIYMMVWYHLTSHYLANKEYFYLILLFPISNMLSGCFSSTVWSIG